jgi:hypothetical protein
MWKHLGKFGQTHHGDIADATWPRSPAFAMTLRSTPISAPCPKCIAQFTGSG